MKISKYELCSSCRKIRPVMSDGNSSSYSIEEMLDSPGYNQPGSYVMFSLTFLLPYLQKYGGCNSCIKLVERSINS